MGRGEEEAGTNLSSIESQHAIQNGRQVAEMYKLLQVCFGGEIFQRRGIVTEEGQRKGSSIYYLSYSTKNIKPKTKLQPISFQNQHNIQPYSLLIFIELYNFTKFNH